MSQWNPGPTTVMALTLWIGLTACGGSPAAPEEAAEAPEPPGQEGSGGRPALEEMPNLEELLTVREFREAGLDQLDEDQLTALNEALQSHLTREQERESRYMREARDSFGFPHEHPIAQETRKIESRYRGEVSDLEKGSRLELENGHVWEVIDSRPVRISPTLQDPRVTVRRGWFGSFRMEFEGHNQTATVRRVE